MSDDDKIVPVRPDPTSRGEPAAAAGTAGRPSLSPLERDEYADFYRATVPRLTAYLVLVHGASVREAGECAHDALVDLLRHWSQVAMRTAWCRTAAKHYFHRRKFDAVESYDEVPASGAPLYAGDDRELDSRHRHEVIEMIAQLAPRQREVVVLTLEGYSVAEIALELGVAPATVRSTLRDTRVHLTKKRDRSRHTRRAHQERGGRHE